MGNGFPLGAVITSSEIGSALDQASIANTFGGNALACAVGTELLNVGETISIHFKIVQLIDIPYFTYYVLSKLW